MGIESFLAGSLNSASTNGLFFFPILAATLAYFHYEVLDNEASPIDVPSEMLLPSYHFIVIGGGSAGTCTCSKLSLLWNTSAIFYKSVIQRQIHFFLSFPSFSFCIRSCNCQPTVRNWRLECIVARSRRWRTWNLGRTSYRRISSTESAGLAIQDWATGWCLLRYYDFSVVPPSPFLYV